MIMADFWLGNRVTHGDSPPGTVMGLFWHRHREPYRKLITSLDLPDSALKAQYGGREGCWWVLSIHPDGERFLPEYAYNRVTDV